MSREPLSLTTRTRKRKTWQNISKATFDFRYVTWLKHKVTASEVKLEIGQCRIQARVARSPVFYRRSRISDPFSRLPGEAAGKNKSPVFC